MKQTILLAVLAVLMSGCGGASSSGGAGGGTTDPVVPVIESLAILPGDMTLDMDSEAALSVLAHYSDGAEMAVNATWACDNNTLATLDGTTGPTVVVTAHY